jgi:hypothetical protein
MRIRYLLLIFFVVGFLFSFRILIPVAAAQTSSNPGAQPLSAERRAELETQLADLERQIAAQRDVLTSKQRESVSLERDVAILNAKIQEAKLSIRARNIVISQLGNDIRGKEQTIGVLSSKIDQGREALAQILRQTNELDEHTLAEFALNNQTISDFFSDLTTFALLKKELKESFADLGNAKEKTQSEKETLEEKQKEEIELKNIQLLQEKEIEDQEAEKKRILKVSKGIEKEYQKLITEKEQSAQAIRAELFQLRGSAAIPFEKAYEYAQLAEQKTGVRAAFILGIIATESNLGENLGSGTWRADMAPRDWNDFQAITGSLGLNPDQMPISARPCSRATREALGPGVPCGYGWGGAMGPGQFIPSTWLLYTDRISDLTGNRPANPWNPIDAFMGTALLSKDNGADKDTRAAERLAALRYLAGWKNATKPAYAFYGDQVMNYAADFDAKITILKNSESTN